MLRLLLRTFVAWRVERNDLTHHHHELHLVEAVVLCILKSKTNVVETLSIQPGQNVITSVKLRSICGVCEHVDCRDCRESTQLTSLAHTLTPYFSRYSGRVCLGLPCKFSRFFILFCFFWAVRKAFRTFRPQTFLILAVGSYTRLLIFLIIFLRLFRLLLI